MSMKKIWLSLPGEMSLSAWQFTSRVGPDVPTLHDLYIRHGGKVSDKWDFYLRTYEELFAPFPRRVGGMRGGSLRGVEWPKDCEAIEVGDAVIDSRRIREALGWHPRVGLGEGLARTREYFRPRLARFVEETA